jgi:hypothetical protein
VQGNMVKVTQVAAEPDQRTPIRLARAHSPCEARGSYSHSMVAGGLLEMS